MNTPIELPKSQTGTHSVYDWADFQLSLDTGPPVLRERLLEVQVGVAFRGQTNALWRVGRESTKYTSFRPGTSWIYGNEPFIWAKIPATHHCLNITIKSDRFLRTAEQNGFGSAIELCPSYFLDDKRLFHITSLIRLELLNPDGSDEIYRKVLSDLLALHLIQHYCDLTPPEDLHRSVLSRAVMRRVTSYLEEHLENRVSLEDMAEIANMSTYHFARAFRDFSGVPPHQYLMQCRIERARQLLRKTRIPIAEVAWRLGYQDQSYFTKLFRREVGTTPSQFRRDC